MVLVMAVTIDAANMITEAVEVALILINVHTKWPLQN